MSKKQSSISSFKEYRNIVFTLVKDLRQLHDFANEQGLDETVIQVKDILLRVESHSFSIAVVGEFKRGKSTFINALLGKEILPADILPTSATLNRVTFGLKPSVRVFFKSQPDEEERVEDIAIDRLADYVTKLTPESEAIAATVREAVVYYPVPYCKNNVDIIDTPGLGDEVTMTAVTMEALPRVDAAIMVVMANAPFSASEGDFLDRLLEQGMVKVIFVVTALDRIQHQKDQKRIVQETLNRIKKRIQKYAETKYGKNTEEYHRYLKHTGKPRVFGLSGYQAVEAKRTNNAALLEESRFAEFEAVLEKFLTEEVDALVLQARVRQIIGTGKIILQHINSQAETLKAWQQKFESKAAVITALLGVLLQMGQEEMNQIDEAVEGFKERIRPLVTQWETDLKNAVAQVIEMAQITWAKLDNYDTFSKSLEHLLIKGVQNKDRQLAEKVNSEIQSELAQEMVRLHPFAMTFDRIMQHIGLQLAQVDTDWMEDKIATVKNRVVGSMLAKLGGRSGYDQSVKTVTASDPIASDSIQVAQSKAFEKLVAELKIPVMWIRTSLDSRTVHNLVIAPPDEKFLKRATRKLAWVTEFKKTLTKTTADELEKLFRAEPASAKIAIYISATFDTLKREVSDFLRQSQNQLVELHGQEERLNVLNEREQHRLNKMRMEVEAILHRAQQLSSQLMENDEEPSIKGKL